MVPGIVRPLPTDEEVWAAIWNQLRFQLFPEEEMVMVWLPAGRVMGMETVV